MSDLRRCAMLVFTSAVFGAVGCGSISADPIQARPSELVTAGGLSNDPYACEMLKTGDGSASFWEEEYSPVCKLTGNSCAHGGISGYQEINGETKLVTGHLELQMVCEHLCHTDSDCPVPESGTAMASCFINPGSYAPDTGVCIVSCEGGETCQDGFECTGDEPLGVQSPWTCVGETQTVSISYTYEPQIP